MVGLYRAATEASELPVIVYDNPRTSSFRFSLETYAVVAALPGIASIKIPGVPEGLEQARDHVASIRAVVPEHVTIGVSGDHLAALGLLAGCDAWYSVVAGIVPEAALRILAAARSQSVEATMAEVAVLEPLFDLFAECQGSVRVIAALAEHVGLASADSLPAPLMGLSAEQRNAAASIADGLDLISA